MKMVKRILLGLAAGAVILSLVGCGPKDDDTEGAITGSGSNYKVKYTNPSTKAKDYYRAYNTTTLKHSGALVKITFDNTNECGDSKMGLIFDLKDSTNTKAGKGARDFFIIGVGANNALYVSKYENIVDIQGDNFGAKTTNDASEGQPTETEYIKLSNGNFNLSSVKNADGTMSLYVYCKAKTDGSYEFALLKGEPTDSSVKMKINGFDIEQLPAGVTTLSLPSAVSSSGCTISENVGTISNAFTPVQNDSDIAQNKLAVYAMIDVSKTLEGSWKFYGTYLEAEEIVE